MLNISPNGIRDRCEADKYASLSGIEQKSSGRVLTRLLIGALILMIIIAFIPWTQNIRARGQLTTLKPDQRPQTIHNVIPGRIEEWHIQEGDFVKKGDTILFISEVKEEYFDPQLLSRTQEQLDAKQLSVGSYMEKVAALDNQIQALRETATLKQEQANIKLQQAQFMVVSDSIELEAAITNNEIAERQFERMEKLYEQGLKSLTEFEQRKLTRQKTTAELIAAENHLLASMNEVLNARVALTTIAAEYRDAISKAESQKFEALSAMYDAQALATKLQNQYMNYSVRSGLYYITSPQDGYITKALQSGIGETIKEGVEIVSIMPAEYDLAVEIYVRPIDLPLLARGRQVRLQFDGWPAIVFSGWPGASFGTYGGTIFAIDNFISENGMFRILVQPDSSDKPWPEALRVGGGANGLILLDDVPIWYELWRQINAFPPNYYAVNENQTGETKK